MGFFVVLVRGLGRLATATTIFGCRRRRFGGIVLRSLIHLFFSYERVLINDVDESQPLH